MTTNRIMKVHEFEKAIYYRASCSCGEPDCDLTLELERDDDCKMIFLNMYKNLCWSAHWRSDNFFQILWRKIKMACRILFTGYTKVEECFIFCGDEQIDDFLNALKEGRNYLKEAEIHAGYPSGKGRGC